MDFLWFVAMNRLLTSEERNLIKTLVTGTSKENEIYTLPLEVPVADGALLRTASGNSPAVDSAFSGGMGITSKLLLYEVEEIKTSGKHELLFLDQQNKNQNHGRILVEGVFTDIDRIKASILLLLDTNEIKILKWEID